MSVLSRCQSNIRPSATVIRAITRRISDVKRYHYPEGTTKESARLFRKREKARIRKEKESIYDTPISFGFEPGHDIRTEPCPERKEKELNAIRRRKFPNPDLEYLGDRAMFVLADSPVSNLLQLLRTRSVEREMIEEDGRTVHMTDDVPYLYKGLIDEILLCDQLYYADDPKPRVSDQDYDELIMHLLELERRFPELIVQHSPSQNIGHTASARAAQLALDGEIADEPVNSMTSFASTVSTSTKRFAPYRHPALMLSLDNAYSHDDLLSFVRRAENAGSSIAAELKIDGVALSLEYRHGKLVAASTRGTGRIGDNVTENVISALTGRGVVLSISGEHVPEWMLVRGEVFISPKDFTSLNQSLERPLSNARNAAAGALKHKDVDECKRRQLQFIAYECLTANIEDVEDAESRNCATSNGSMKTTGDIVRLSVEATNTFSTQEETLFNLQSWGFGSMVRHSVCNSLEELEMFAIDVENERDALPMEVDGIVFKFNDSRAREKAGHTARAPRGSIAFKFAAQSRVTTVTDVVMQVSRQGIITPVAVLEPVRIGGATLSRATLHNFEEVERLGVAIGDNVRLERGGDVIPKVISVERKGDASSRRLIKAPETCPSCGGGIVANAGKNRVIMYTCKNNYACTGQTLGRLIHFASRDAMDIQLMGKKTAQRLVSAGLVVVVADIFRLTLDDILSLEGYGEKSALKLLASISEVANSRSLERLLLGLGLPGIGRIGARSLALKVESIGGLLAIGSSEDGKDILLGIPNIAEKTASALYEHLQREQYVAELMALEQLVKPIKIVDDEEVEVSENEEDKSNIVVGSSFAFTGKFVEMNRPNVMKWVKQNGGRVVNDVSKKTDFVVCGLDPGNKLFKAQRLKKQVVKEEEFFLFFDVPEDVRAKLRLKVGATENGKSDAMAKKQTPSKDLQELVVKSEVGTK